MNKVTILAFNYFQLVYESAYLLHFEVYLSPNGLCIRITT